MDWIDTTPNDERTLSATTDHGERVRLTRYGSNEGPSVAGRWNWQASGRRVSASGILDTQEEAQRALDVVLPILRDADAKIAEALTRLNDSPVPG